MPGFGFIIDRAGAYRRLSPTQTLPASGPHSAWLTIELTCNGAHWHFFGFLHGRARLARDLAMPTTDATALLGAAFERWPRDWPQRITGHWVCARWCPGDGDLTLWRESSGLFSLYWAWADGARYVATDLGPLADALGVCPGGHGLHEYLHLLDIAPPQTIYPQIMAVPAGEALTWPAMAAHPHSLSDGAQRTDKASVSPKQVWGLAAMRTARQRSVWCFSALGRGMISHGEIGGRHAFPSPPTPLTPAAERAAGPACPTFAPNKETGGRVRLACHDEDQALTVIEARLSEAVATSLEDLKRPAAFLSSGVDSTLLCALAARHRSDLTVVTVGLEEADEAPRAVRIAQYLGLRHEVWRYRRSALLHAFEEWVANAPQPMADPATPVTLLAFRDAVARFDGVLDGTGADELMGAMPPRHWRLAVQWLSLMPAPLRHRMTVLARRLPGGYAPMFEFDHPAEVLRRWKGFTAHEIAQLFGAPVDLEQTLFYRVFRRYKRSAHFVRYSALLEAMPCDRLGHAMQITGLDVRLPYWTPIVRDMLRCLPAALRWRRDSPKHLLRALLARYVPAALWDGPKRGFDFPLRSFLRDEDFHLLRRYLLDAAPGKDCAIYNPQVDDLVKRFKTGDSTAVFRIWALIVLSAWSMHHPCEGEMKTDMRQPGRNGVREG